MATAPIRKPALYKSPGTPWPGLQLSAIGDSTNTFEAGQFVKLSSGALAAYVADDTGIIGLTPDGSHAATDEPFNSLYGQNHNVIGLVGQRFIMNTTNGSGHVGSGSSQAADLTIGTLYSARYLESPYTTTLAVDASDAGTATKNIFKVVGKYDSSIAPDGDATADYNTRVIVEVIAAGIQAS